eukprot:1355981-Amphidinium_carterae.2
MVEPVKNVFDWWQDEGGLQAEHPHSATALDLLGFEGPPAKSDLAFDHVLMHDGLLHTVHNASKYLGSAIPGYAENIHKLKKVVKLLRSRQHRDRLLERCFSGPVACHYRDLIQSFSAGEVHENRWGTVAFALPEVLRLERPLRYAWSKDVFLAGEEELNTAVNARPGDEEHSAGSLAAVCDEALTDDKWFSPQLLVWVSGSEQTVQPSNLLVQSKFLKLSSSLESLETDPEIPH